MKRSPLKRTAFAVRKNPSLARSTINVRRSKPRRGRLVDKNYLGWLATQPCIVSGQSRVTLHHVRFCGSPKDDRRTVPLAAEYHLIQHGATSVEALGKAAFERLHYVDLEASIVRLNALYERLKGT